MFKKRQSSSVSTTRSGYGTSNICFLICGQIGLKSRAMNVRLPQPRCFSGSLKIMLIKATKYERNNVKHQLTAKRKYPTGGLAYGMPRYE